jgi:predicted enzyme related to lactoylglutathione lyase
MVKILSIVWGVKDMPRAVAFWSAALDYARRYPVEEGEVFVILVPRSGAQPSGMQLSLKLSASEKAHRHHMDLIADDQTAEVERLISLGARPVAEWRYEPDADYVVLQDPDGNCFCVVQDLITK